jgi:MYXO-CTERM domain-containing protein
VLPHSLIGSTSAGFGYPLPTASAYDSHHLLSAWTSPDAPGALLMARMTADGTVPEPEGWVMAQDPDWTTSAPVLSAGSDGRVLLGYLRYDPSEGVRTHRLLFRWLASPASTLDAARATLDARSPPERADLPAQPLEPADGPVDLAPDPDAPDPADAAAREPDAAAEPDAARQPDTTPEPDAAQQTGPDTRSGHPVAVAGGGCQCRLDRHASVGWGWALAGLAGLLLRRRTGRTAR